MKVYLAGKISPHDWREKVTGLSVFSFGGEFGRPEKFPRAWRLKPGTVGAHYVEVTGPFFVGCDHGCTHGASLHGVSGGCEQDDPGVARYEARRLCLDAINRSDLVFAWLDDLTAYGTIAEIGYAVGRGKRTIVGVHVPLDGAAVDPVDDAWFASGMAGEIVGGPDPLTALELAITKATPRTFDSPVEKQFWDAYEMSSPASLKGLVTQHQVGRYRVDFALPERKFAIEIDGLVYHGDQVAFIKDRERQRALEMNGWRVARFAAKEVMRDAFGCVSQAAQLAARG